MKTVEFEGDFESWREAARELLASGVPPEILVWSTTRSRQSSVLDTIDTHDVPDRSRQQLAVTEPRVPRRFIDVARRVSHHRDPSRWTLLYRILWRITHGESKLLEITVDADTSQLREMDEDVRAAGGDAPRQNAARFVPDTTDIATLRGAVQDCRGCELCALSHGPVFGEGSSSARVMLVGEQPDDCDDHEQRPFVGPDGHLLDRALTAAGIPTLACYVTHAVKAFKFSQPQQKRIQRRLDTYETGACKPWLEAEVRAVEPTVIVALGAMAAHAVTGRRIAIVSERGEQSTPLAPHCIVTYHPSAILRVPDQVGRQRRFDQLVRDLTTARQLADIQSY